MYNDFEYDIDNSDKYEQVENPEGIDRFSIIDRKLEWISICIIITTCLILEEVIEEKATYFNALSSLTVWQFGISIQ